MSEKLIVALFGNDAIPVVFRSAAGIEGNDFGDSATADGPAALVLADFCLFAIFNH